MGLDLPLPMAGSSAAMAIALRAAGAV